MYSTNTFDEISKFYSKSVSGKEVCFLENFVFIARWLDALSLLGLLFGLETAKFHSLISCNQQVASITEKHINELNQPTKFVKFGSVQYF